MTRPMEWKRGTAQTIRSRSGSISRKSSMSMSAAMIPRWVCIAPLGWPVVPDVYMMAAVSPSSTSAGVKASAGEDRRTAKGRVPGGGDSETTNTSRSVSRCSSTGATAGQNSSSTTRRRDWELSISKASSSPLNRVFRGTAMAPSFISPKKVSGKSNPTPMSRATRSPFPIPNVCRRAYAIRVEISSSSAKVMRRFPAMSPTRSGCLDTVPARISLIFRGRSLKFRSMRPPASISSISYLWHWYFRIFNLEPKGPEQRRARGPQDRSRPRIL